jgi:phosphoribosylformylglycinamidine synthase
MGRKQEAPCDAAVIKPLYNERAGLVVSNGLCPKYSQFDSKIMALCAVDEAIRNAVCVGADPDTISLLDNFCWSDPVLSANNPQGKYKLAQLVRACEGLYEAVLAHGAPLISGKDSMKNDFNDGIVSLSILPTLLVSAIGRIDQASQAVTMQFKNAGDSIYLLSAGRLGLLGSELLELYSYDHLDLLHLPESDLNTAAQAYRLLHACIKAEMIQSCHDLSEGGLAVALSECIIGSNLGASVDIDRACAFYKQFSPAIACDTTLFGEGPGHLLISVSPDKQKAFQSRWHALPGKLTYLGSVSEEARLKVQFQSKPLLDVGASELRAAWKAPLPLN